MVIPRAALSRLNFDNGLNKFAYWESPKANDLFLESQIKIGHRADQKNGPRKYGRLFTHQNSSREQLAHSQFYNRLQTRTVDQYYFP